MRWEQKFLFPSYISLINFKISREKGEIKIEVKNKNMKIVLFILSIIFIINTTVLAGDVFILEIIHDKNEEIIEKFELKPGDIFELEHTHSAQNAYVNESFSLTKDGKFMLFEMKFTSQGLGLPDAVGGKFKLKDGKFYWTDINRIIPKLNIRVGNISRIKFKFNNKIYSLIDYVDDTDLVIIKARRK